MPDINFPNSPSGGDTYTYKNITYNYDGEKWTAKGGTTNTDQTLSAAGNVITISGNNDTVDLTTMLAPFSKTDSQDLTLSGNVISLSGQSGNVDLTSLLALGYFDPTSEVTFTKDVHFQRGVEEKFGSLSGQSGTVAHNLNDGHVFYHTTPAGNFTANFTNFNLDAGYTTAITIIVNQGATAYIPNAVQIGGSAQTLNWQGGSAPSGTSNGIDAISFTILNDSGSYIVLGQLVDFT